jgi:hypothetical protein
MKNILLALVGTVMLIGALSSPTPSAADGGPWTGNCPPTQMCKP